MSILCYTECRDPEISDWFVTKIEVEKMFKAMSRM